MLSEKLKKITKGEIIDAPEELKTYSRDASIFELTPEVVVAPKDANDLQKLVLFASEERRAGNEISLTARAAGTCMSGGSLSESIVLDFKPHFNRLISIDANSCAVEPGMYFRDLETRLKEKNLLLPSFPASRGLCTIGGMVANNSAGEKTLSYGQTANFVTRLKMVASNGQEYVFEPLMPEALEAKCRLNTFEGVIYRDIQRLIDKNRPAILKAKPHTSKNSSGYALWDVEHDGLFDITKILVGSQGTLGLITEITLRLEKIKPYTHTVAIFLYDLEKLVETIEVVLAQDPEAFECYDDQTLRLALKYLPEKMQELKNGWPDFSRVTGEMLPRLTLLAEISSENITELHRKLSDLTAKLDDYGLTYRIASSPKEADAFWSVRHESFNLLRLHADHMQCAPFIDDIIVSPEYLPKFLPELQAILDAYKDIITYTVAGHIGDGNFHILPLIDIESEKTRLAIPKIMDEVFALVKKYKGSTAAEHNDGLIRGHYLPTMFGEEISDLFRQVKHIFDPEGIFNPHKKTAATAEYSFKHLKTSNESMIK
ncbi:MAG TPA: FAD-binding oxidoreductase [Candidatus Paceibacterota bacterium]|nr:FAD-binding oxidoreductase [Candidatus Paceibacterota bacterium]